MGGNCSSDTTGSSPSSTKNDQQQQQQQQDGKDNPQQQQSQGNKEDSNNPLREGGRPSTHFKCRNDIYAGCADVRRCDVPDDKVTWEVTYEDYKPVEFFFDQEVPIEEDEDFRKKKTDVRWNERDNRVNRKSHQGAYEVIDGVPRNPVGRTGVVGRGKLARWGPNHAADPVVTRWKRYKNGKVVHDETTGKPVLEFITIQRGDTKEWAIPGGFVDSGEEAYSALKREFCEEAMNSTAVTEKEKEQIVQKLDQLFTDGTQVYKGYVDDPRNTDNSWMETEAYNFHDEKGEMVGKLKLQAGDDAVGVQWQDVASSLDLYASHAAFVQQVAQLHDSHW